MIHWIQNIKSLLSLSKRIGIIESEIQEMEAKLTQSVVHYSKEFEDKIQHMAFAYTKNLDDTKSDYLKRYLEVRMNCMQAELSQLPQKLQAMQGVVDRLLTHIENTEDD
jgi:predicted SprT family Zn-dependent metalloprotease